MAEASFIFIQVRCLFTVPGHSQENIFITAVLEVGGRGSGGRVAGVMWTLFYLQHKIRSVGSFVTAISQGVLRILSPPTVKETNWRRHWEWHSACLRAHNGTLFSHCLIGVFGRCIFSFHICRVLHQVNQPVVCYVWLAFVHCD